MATRIWSEETEQLLRKAGWHEGRDVGDHQLLSWNSKLAGPSGFEMFRQAEDILREFGGLSIDQPGPGQDFARTGFVLDPTLAEGERDRFSQFEAGIGSRLFPLGETADGHAFLATAEDGRVFLIMDDLIVVGSSFDEAVGSLLEGRSPPDRSV